MLEAGEKSSSAAATIAYLVRAHQVIIMKRHRYLFFRDLLSDQIRYITAVVHYVNYNMKYLRTKKDRFEIRIVFSFPFFFPGLIGQTSN